jgi:hypothetical protein
MRREGAKSFEQLQASLLYCDRCKKAMPVVQRLLLVLPDGELHDYLCRQCGRSIGQKRETTRPTQGRILTP